MAIKIIGGNAPGSYLEKIKRRADISDGQLDAYLKSHAIQMATLEADDFDDFFNRRESELLDRIEKAMGKRVQRGHADEEDLYDDPDIDEDADVVDDTAPMA